MSQRGAFVQGYNAQALVGEGRVIIAAEVTARPTTATNSADAQRRARTQRDRTRGKIKCVLADGGYWNHDQIAKVRQSTVVVIPTSDPHTRQRKQRPGRAPRPTASKILATAAGSASTAAEPNSSNPSSRTPNTPARSPASAAADSPPSTPNGG